MKTTMDIADSILADARPLAASRSRRDLSGSWCVIALDTNILVYAHRSDSEFQAPAALWLRGLAEGHSAWAIPWPCVHQFLAVATDPRIYRPASTLREAVGRWKHGVANLAPYR